MTYNEFKERVLPKIIPFLFFWFIITLIYIIFHRIGSSNFSPEQETVGKVDVLTLDAPRRTIISNESGLVCAEPIPDIAVATALELAASLKNFQIDNEEKPGAEGDDADDQQNSFSNINGNNNHKFDANINQKLNTALDKLYSRSHGIQVLRDGMFRLCEAHLNNAIGISEYGYYTINLISSLNFIVPIELCTGLLADSMESLKEVQNNQENQLTDDQIISPETYYKTLNVCIEQAGVFASRIVEENTKRLEATVKIAEKRKETESINLKKANIELERIKLFKELGIPINPQK